MNYGLDKSDEKAGQCLAYTISSRGWHENYCTCALIQCRSGWPRVRKEGLARPVNKFEVCSTKCGTTRRDPRLFTVACFRCFVTLRSALHSRENSYCWNCRCRATAATAHIFHAASRFILRRLLKSGGKRCRSTRFLSFSHCLAREREERRTRRWSFRFYAWTRNIAWHVTTAAFFWAQSGCSPRVSDRSEHRSLFDEEVDPSIHHRFSSTYRTWINLWIGRAVSSYGYSGSRSCTRLST